MANLQFSPATKATRRAKVLLLGEAGTGKTHAALTFPKPAVIDAEGSADWFADRFAFVSVNTKSYADARDLLAQVRGGRVDCETVVIDSLTTIYNGLVLAASRDRDDLRPLDWGRIKRKFSSLLDELYHKTDKHVVCIGWIKPEYAKPGETVNGERVKPNDLVRVGEAFDGDRKTSFAFDFIFKIEGNDGKRTKATVIKSRSGELKAGQVIPDFSFKTLEALLPAGDRIASGMTDEEAVERDAFALQDAPRGRGESDGGGAAQTGSSGQETLDEALAQSLRNKERADRALALGYDLGCMDNTGDKRADAYALLEWLRLQRELVAEDATLRKWSPAAIEIAVPFLEDLLAQAGEAAKAAKDAEEQEPFNADEPIVNAANQAEIAIAASPLFGEQEKGETADPDPKILSLADRIEANKAKTRSRAR